MTFQCFELGKSYGEDRHWLDVFFIQDTIDDGEPDDKHCKVEGGLRDRVYSENLMDMLKRVIENRGTGMDGISLSLNDIQEIIELKNCLLECVDFLDQEIKQAQ